MCGVWANNEIPTNTVPNVENLFGPWKPPQLLLAYENKAFFCRGETGIIVIIGLGKKIPIFLFHPSSPKEFNKFLELST